MKMKVKVENLKNAIHKFVGKAQKEHEKDLVLYREQREKDTQRHIQNVEAYLRDLRAGKDPEDGSYELRNRLHRGCKWPSQPKEPSKHVDLLVKLDLAEDQILVVDDHSDYMKFLSGKCVCS